MTKTSRMGILGEDYHMSDTSSKLEEIFSKEEGIDGYGSFLSPEEEIKEDVDNIVSKGQKGTRLRDDSPLN